MPSITYLIIYPAIGDLVLSNTDSELKQTKLGKGIFSTLKCPDLPIAPQILPFSG